MQHLLFGLLLTSFSSSLLFAKTVTVTPDKDLVEIIQNAKSGEHFILADGVYTGNLVVDQSITLEGSGDSQIVGDAKGSVIHINAPDVVIKNLKISNSGIDLSTQDSGIFVNKTAHNVQIENNTLNNNLIGIYLWGPKEGLVQHNHIVGRTDLRENERGNGIQVWNSIGSEVRFNNVRDGRDGIFVTTSSKNVFSDNTFTNVRYSIHYMYTNSSQIERNISNGNDIGYALMYSNDLVVRDNISLNDKDHGLFANFLNRSEVMNNVVLNGKDKCLFVYNSNSNTIADNYFKHCLVGVHWTAGSDNNIFYNNAFIDNQKQVKYVSTKHLEWSHEKQGNYWSNHNSYDMNNNGIADSAYRPNDISDKILWKYPNAAILLDSPVMQLLKWSGQHFPSLLPGGILDSYPLMSPNKIAIQTLSKVPHENSD